MKKVFSVFLALVATFWATTAALADTYTGTIVVDYPDRVSVSVNYSPVSPDNQGVFHIETESDYTYVQITPSSGDYGLSSVTAVDSESKPAGSEYISSNSCGFQLGSYTNGYTWTVTTYSYADLRTATCTIKVDNASKVTVRRPDYSSITLVDGDNPVAFIPAGTTNAEVPFNINPKNSSAPLYKVLVNGTEQEAKGAGYSITPVDGDVIEIQANYPDADVPVSFTAVNEGTEGFITKVEVDGVEATNWADDDFTVKLGSTVTWYGNNTDYKVNTITTNGTSTTYFYGSLSFFVGTEDAQTVEYDVEKYGTFTITIDIDHANRVTFTPMMNYTSGDALSLVDGLNTVELSEKVTGLKFTVASGCWIESFTDANGTEYKDNTSYYGFSIQDGDAFTVTTGEVSRESSFVFYVDDPSIPPYGGSVGFTTSRYTVLGFQNGDDFADGGYYTFAFDPDYDGTLNISCYGGGNPYIYQNDECISAGTSTSYTLTVADGDVLKLFLAGEPASYDVTFTVESGAAPRVVRDLILPVEDLTSTLSVLDGTRIDIDAETVTVDGTSIEKGENGLFSVEITAATEIEISGDATITTAISNAQVAADNNVYTLQGMLLIKNATQAQINALPAGLYIINGKTSYLLQR